MYAAEGDPKAIVRAGYDACSPRYNTSRSSTPSPELNALIKVLPTSAEVLDIGCGGGRPVSETLSRHASITGVDISSVQIEAARKALPESTFIVADITSQEFAHSSFDAIVSLYALFHVPREEHEGILGRMAAWLRPGGYLLMTVARSSHAGYTERDFYGVTMFWSHYDPDWYADTLERLGFKVLDRGVIGHGYNDAEDPPLEHHPYLFARASNL